MNFLPLLKALEDIENSYRETSPLFIFDMQEWVKLPDSAISHVARKVPHSSIFSSVNLIKAAEADHICNTTLCLAGFAVRHIPYRFIIQDDIELSVLAYVCLDNQQAKAELEQIMYSNTERQKQYDTNFPHGVGWRSSIPFDVVREDVEEFLAKWSVSK